MYDFSASADNDWDYLTTIVIFGECVTLAVLFWFSIRKPRMNSTSKFRVWFVLSTGIVFGQLLGIANFPSHALAALSCGVAAIIICMIGGLREFLRSERESGLKPALSILEVGVILVIQAILCALCLPTVGSGTSTRRTTCKNNLKQLALAMHNYHDVYGRFPVAAGIRSEAPKQVPVSWRVALLPYIEQSQLFTEYNPEMPWNSQANLPIAARRIALYICPSQPVIAQSNAESQFFTSYVVPTGNHSIFPMDGKPAHSLTEITDGTSNSLLIMEACGTRIVWTNPQDIDVDSTTIGINLPGHEPGLSDGIMSSHHTGGAQAALADGSVRFISADTDPKLLKALLTVDGKEEVGDY
ncbi:MAG: DUF1559 domain-containing protein [Planctomycetaceae bacterium]